jgi:ribonuclease G
MSSILLISAAPYETRVALVENGAIAEYYLERKAEKGIVGNIYKGRVVRVLPGMQAAFVDIGLEKAAFLYVGDVIGEPSLFEEYELSEAPEGEHPAHFDEEERPVPAEDEPDVAPEPAPAAPAGAETATATAAETATASATEQKPETVTGSETATAPVAVTAAEAMAAANAAAAALDAAAHIQSHVTEHDSAHIHNGAPEAAAAPGAAAIDEDAELVAEEVGEPPREGERGRPEGRDDRRGGRGRGRRDNRRRDAPQEKPQGEREHHGRTSSGPPRRPKQRAQIQDLLKVGDEVIVQIAKEPIGTKGPRITTHVSLPGRHLVFMPTVDHVGISRRIDEDRERRRLREIVDAHRPPGTGFIVRTVAENVPTEKLTADIKFLIGLWNDVVRKRDTVRAPALLHPDLDLILRATRDLFSNEVEKLIVDERAEYERICEFLQQNVPDLKAQVVLHDSDTSIFEDYGIEQELARALSRKVWLKSGGYIIFDQAEALTAIDVNSGRYVGKKNLEETITKTNMEAAREIVYQLRLRNIGGIIIIDFIDMDKGSNRDKVYKALQEALGRDRAKTNVLKISELGLVEMTRKRVRESVFRTMHEPCAFCDGRGYNKSKRTIAHQIFREFERSAKSWREDTVLVNCHPAVAEMLQHEERETLRFLMMKYNKTIQIRAQPQNHQEQYDLHPRWARRAEKDEKPPRGGGDKERNVTAAPAPDAATAGVPNGGKS